jgi:hypothetical protein
MKQKWDNVIALYNYRYNGNFDFSGYQWYKNDSLLFNETNSYLYLDNPQINDEYSVEIFRPDGTKCFSCPLVLNYPQLSMFSFPTVMQGSKIKIQYPNKVKSLNLFTVTGMFIKNIIPEYPVQYLELPYAQQMYLLDVQLDNGQHKVYHISR